MFLHRVHTSEKVKEAQVNDNNKWWQESFTDELSIFALAVIAVIALFVLPNGGGKEIAIAVASGLVGYMRGITKNNSAKTL